MQSESFAKKTIELDTNATGLYVMDIADFCKEHSNAARLPESFVGHTQHVEDMTCSQDHKTQVWKTKWQVPTAFGMPRTSVRSHPIPEPEPYLSNSSTGPKPDSPPETSNSQSVHHGVSHSDDQHAERCRQRHRGNVDTRSSVVDESDRDEHAAGRGRDADCDLTAVGNNVPGACARS